MSDIVQVVREVHLVSADVHAVYFWTEIYLKYFFVSDFLAFW